MSPFQINEEEWNALEGEPLKVFKIYCLIRRHMNYATGISGHLSEDAFRKALVVRVVKGRRKDSTTEFSSISQKEIRKIIDRLVTLGLIDNLRGYLFRCKIANLDKSIQKMRGVSGAQRGAQKNKVQPLVNKQSYSYDGIDDGLMRGAEQVTGNKENNNTNVLLKKKRACKLTDEFCVTENHIAVAAKSGLPNPHDEIDAFKDYHISKGNLYADWDRAFYTWLRNSKKFKGGNYAGHNQTRRKSNTENFWDEMLSSGIGTTYEHI